MYAGFSHRVFIHLRSSVLPSGALCSFVVLVFLCSRLSPFTSFRYTQNYPMDHGTHNQIVSFIWNIADDCLRDIYRRGEYRNVILPMTVIRRLDAVLESTKDAVLAKKKELERAGVENMDDGLCKIAGQAFCNSSPFKLRDLTARSTPAQLKADFAEYLDGFSPNVQEVIEKFAFRNQIQKMLDAGILGSVIEKFVSPHINVSHLPVLNRGGNVVLPALSNHAMGTVFEELIRRFNEENNEEAGEHFTPRDVVELMADLIFFPIADKILDSSYSCYDGACGTGGMLTVAEERLLELAKKKKKQVAIHLFGQEVQAETYAIAKADLLLKGDGAEADNLAFGSTLSSDAFPAKTFDFMLSNPPYGKSWKVDAEKLGGKKGILDPRFVTSFGEETNFSMVPRSSDGQLLFLLNNVAKMKTDTALGSRIAEVHNGSSLFTGDAGQGESNARRFMIENDLVEAVIALPENMFYNTGIATFIWLLANKKAKKRRGKIQLIDATAMGSPLRKNLGKKNGEFTRPAIKRIVNLLAKFEEAGESRIFDNEEFGYWKITVYRPKRNQDGKIEKDKKGNIIPDSVLTDTEQIPFTYTGGVPEFFETEVKPYAPDVWYNEKETKTGYEISFTKYFYKPVELRPLEEITVDIKALEAETRGLLERIIENR
jgi:type I restriction enzyme M protein